MLKPRSRQRTERSLGVGQFADDFGLGTGVREDVQEVVDNHREVGVVDMTHVVQKFTSRLWFDQLVKRCAQRTTPRALEQSFEEILFVLVFAPLFVVIEPQIGHKFIDSQRHESRKNRITGILCSGGQDRAI